MGSKRRRGAIGRHLWLWRAAQWMALALPALPALAASPEAPSLPLAEAIRLAVAHNTQVRNAYLDRVVQQYDLFVAESKFTPRFTLESGWARDGAATGELRRDVDTSLRLSQVLPTGARISAEGRQQDGAGPGERERFRGWSLQITQPLLKDGGWDANTASVRLARLSEQGHVLRLQALLTSTVVATIQGYRSVVQGQESLAISRQSLARSRETVAINKELIAASRMAVKDMSQSEADVARREVDLLAAENSLDGARLALVALLNADPESRWQMTAESETPPVPYHREQALEIAFARRPDHQMMLLQMESLKLQQALARNGRLWELNLVGRASSRRHIDPATLASGGPTAWNLGLALSIPLNDPAREQPPLAADIELRKATASLQQLRLDITTEVRNALRRAEIGRRQIDLARMSRQLSQQNLEMVVEKLKAGRATNFELVSYQNELVAAQKSELNARMGYLNDLTALEQSLGIVLDRWGIELVER